MKVTRYADARSFLDAAEAFLLAKEKLNTVTLGLAGRLARSDEGEDGGGNGWADAVYLAVATDENEQVVGAAVRTHADLPIVLSRTDDVDAVVALVDDVAELDPPPIGLNGLRPDVDMAAARLAQHMGLTVVESMANKVYELSEVRPPAGVAGAMRAPTEDDRDWLIEGVDGLVSEALPNEYHHGRAEMMVDRMYSHGETIARVWDVDGTPVSLAFSGNRSQNCERISGVYTPPDHRGNGYAGALIAGLSQERLDAGYSTLMLYTQNANSTANRVYAEVGFEPIADSAILLLR